jgi:hypothetical protein
MYFSEMGAACEKIFEWDAMDAITTSIMKQEIFFEYYCTNHRVNKIKMKG